MALPRYDKLIVLTQGDAKDVDIYFRKVPANQRIVSARLVIKPTNPADPDGSDLYNTLITVNADATGNQIIADGATDVTGIAYRNLGTIKTGTCLMHWLLTPAFTATLTPGVEYPYGVQVQSSAGFPYEPEHGVLVVTQQINFSTP